MNQGFRISCAVNGQDADLLPAHQRIFCHEGLEEHLDQFLANLRQWIINSAKGRQDDDFQLNHLSITIIGPMMIEEHIWSTEEKLAAAQTAEEGFRALGSCAKDFVDQDRLEEALSQALELQALLGEFESDYFYFDALQSVHNVLGRLAIRKGDIEAAKQHLVACGTLSESPTLMSFGPNMSLAWELLFKGERQAVLDYLQACRSFWKMGSDSLDLWTQDVLDGRIPDFGANLDY